MATRRDEDRTFAEYRKEGDQWITFADGEFYPDVLKSARALYEPVVVGFGELLAHAKSSEDLLRKIDAERNPIRTQLHRVFHRYVCPAAPVESLKVRQNLEENIRIYGERFRPVEEVRELFQTRPIGDETLCALFYEYSQRGKKGYDLTEEFFDAFELRFPDLHIDGPVRAGKDVCLGTVFQDYPNPRRPADFVIRDSGARGVLAVGFARYDSDRGGAQEDDRISGNKNAADEILTYARNAGLSVKVIFLNDGPGLLLGSMWRDYSNLEHSWSGKIRVMTLRMVPNRLTHEWLLS